MATRRTTKGRPKRGKSSTKAPRKTTAKKKRVPARKKAPKKTALKKAAPKKAVKSAKRPAAETKKGATRKARASQTIPGGTAPPVDDVTAAKRALRQVKEILLRANPKDAEQILGDGTLEALLGSIVPVHKSGSIHDHLAKYKRQASLLARLRHGINERSVSKDAGVFISPTKVQWFYDGLTFLEGDVPYGGVVGLYRDGVVRYGIGVSDSAKKDSTGPLAADFVSASEAKKSFRSATSDPKAGLAALRDLMGNNDTEAWTELLADHPWLFGAQYTAVEHHPQGDAELPDVTAKRASDGAQDVLLIESPGTAIVGKTGRVLSSFRETWTRAVQLRSFVQRQSAYLKRELGWKIRDPRFVVLAGKSLSAEDRQAVRVELEMQHSAIRLVTFDELAEVAERTLRFFEARM